VKIRPAQISDEVAVTDIFLDVLREGETFALPRDSTRKDAREFWFAEGNHVYVCEDEDKICGSYYIRANQDGGGAHVANAGYIVDESARGKGIGRAMAEHSLGESKTRGFRAMQFNFVISTNEAAVKLWRDLGFEAVGTLPEAFQHPTRGFVDALVMFRKL